MGWSRRSWDNEILTVLNKGQLAMAIFIDIPESFSGRHIEILRGIHMQGFNKIPPVVLEMI